MYKVMTIVGTRPEIIKLSRVMVLLDKYFKHILVHTGQNYDYELNEIFFKELGIRKPDYFLNAAGKTSAETIALVIKESDIVLRKELPDAILIYGDTNSCLSVIAAKRLRIPIFHMEAGNRCFDQRVPEELNRKIVDHLSDINFTISNQARDYLIREGLRPETIFKVGSSLNEVINYYKSKIDESQILNRLNLRQNKYFIMSFHREENIDNVKNLNSILNSIIEIKKRYNLKILISTHPRTRNKLNESGFAIDKSDIFFLKPFGFFDYIKLQTNAFCAISDSGTIMEESSILEFPAIMIRQTHERPEGMDNGMVVMSGLNFENIISSIDLVTSTHIHRLELKTPYDYSSENVSIVIVRNILSYIEYIRANVWKNF